MRKATRDKIHVAAIKLFAHKGFAATSVQEIADRAGISTGLMYRHYKSKEDLFNELVSQAADGLARNVQLFQSEAPPADLLGELTMEILNDIAHNDNFAEFLMLMNQSSMMEDAPPQVQHLNEQSTALMEQTARLIEKGQALGQFKQGNALEMAHYYFASVHGLTMMKFTMKERFVVPSFHIVTAFLVKEDDHD